MKMNKKGVAKRILDIRLSLGKNTREFGELFDPPASDSIVSRWESGKSLPNASRLTQLAGIAHITVPELLYGSLEERVHNAIIAYVKDNKLDVPSEIELKQIRRIEEKTLDFFKQRKDTIEDYEIDNTISAFMTMYTMSMEIENVGQLDLRTGEIHSQKTLIQKAISSYQQSKNEYEALNRHFDKNIYSETIQSIIAITNEAIAKLEKLKEQ
ncbi:helix-turn-helix domain-containing protein [Enterococcus sp. LJL98]